MALPPFTTVEELSRRVTIQTGDEDKALAALEDASNLIRNEAGHDHWYLDEDSPGGWVLQEDVPEILGTIAIRLAIRAIANPFGAQSTGIDTFQVSWAKEDDYWRAEIGKLAGTAGGLSSLKVHSPVPLGPSLEASVSEDDWEDWDPIAVPGGWSTG